MRESNGPRVKRADQRLGKEQAEVGDDRMQEEEVQQQGNGQGNDYEEPGGCRVNKITSGVSKVTCRRKVTTRTTT